LKPDSPRFDGENPWLPVIFPKKTNPLKVTGTVVVEKMKGLWEKWVCAVKIEEHGWLTDVNWVDA
jgi:hypothetical protein